MKSRIVWPCKKVVQFAERRVSIGILPSGLSGVLLGIICLTLLCMILYPQLTALRSGSRVAALDGMKEAIDNTNKMIFTRATKAGIATEPSAALPPSTTGKLPIPLKFGYPDWGAALSVRVISLDDSSWVWRVVQSDAEPLIGSHLAPHLDQHVTEVRISLRDRDEQKVEQNGYRCFVSIRQGNGVPEVRVNHLDC